MTIKQKVILGIALICITAVTLTVGVWALKSDQFNFGGTINFTATGINATISKGTFNNGLWVTESDATTKMPEVVITNSSTEDTLKPLFDKWSGLNLLFNEDGEDATITFSITNNATNGKDIKAKVTADPGTSNNGTVTASPSIAFISPGEANKQNFTVTFHIEDTDLNASLTNFQLTVDLSVSEPVNESQVSYLTFDYDNDNLTASVTNCAVGTVSADIPEKVRHTYTNDGGQQVTAVYTVTSIADAASYSAGAFYATRSTLTSVSLPITLTGLGDYAFFQCSVLASITIPDSVTSLNDAAFSGCSSLTSAIIGNGVTSIDMRAFYNCSGLTSVTIGKSVTSIGQEAFCYCNKLAELNYLGDINSWAQIDIYNANGSPLFYSKSLKINGVEVTNAVINTATLIGAYTFRACANLTSLTVSDSVTAIGTEAFYECVNLKTVVIDSDPVAMYLTSKASMGCVIYYATTIYIKTGFAVGSYVTTNFKTVEDITTGDYAGYTKYTP